MAGRARPAVAERRKYLIRTTKDAKAVATAWLTALDLEAAVSFGLPEVDDRYHVWRVPLKSRHSQVRVGEVVVDAYTSEVLAEKSTRKQTIEARLLGRSEESRPRKRKKDKEAYRVSSIRNTVALADCRSFLEDMPAESVDLVFTSPPYFNARPEYSEYQEYDEYLAFMRQVIRRTSRVLGEGRFFVINCAPVLLRRASRNEASRRIAVPFDLHRIFVEEGFDFIDDIIWVKPEGAGWATGRGRRFAADRNPLQYKAVPVTEYVLVYRKRSTRLIDWFIRNHPDRDAVLNSRIADGYERTNVWRINPKTNSPHPAPFPIELAQKVIEYYSFSGDVVLDPFAGSGTTGAAAASRGRRFVLAEISEEYVELIKSGIPKWLGRGAEEVLWVNTDPVSFSGQLL